MTETDSKAIYRTKFKVPKMDCPSEEAMIRMAVANEPSIKDLSFDLNERSVTFRHTKDSKIILDLLLPLNLGAEISERGQDSLGAESLKSTTSPGSESKVLKLLLAINAAMFVLELAVGWFADSTGLISDSLDMLADAVVYGLSLYAVGHSIDRQRRAAKTSGYFQLVLALGLGVEVLRRFLFGSDPQSGLMIGTSLVALIANISCLALLAKHRTGAVHMRASWIFSTNDVLANLGVIIAGALVAYTGSPYPDLVIGLIICGFVASGSFRILKLSK